MAVNFSGFFEKLAEIFQSIGSVSPILKEFQALFSESSGLRESLSEFYAVVVEFCTEALQFLKKECMSAFPDVTPALIFFLMRLTYFPEAIRQFAELLWRTPFDFPKFEIQLREQQQTVVLQQSLAAEKAAHISRQEISLYQRRADQHRTDEVTYRMGNEEREVQKQLNTKSELHYSL